MTITILTISANFALSITGQDTVSINGSSLADRRQFPPTPVTAPVLPAWQLSKGDIASEASSSAISITTNVSTTSNSTAQETDSAEDVNLCEDKVVVRTAR